MTYLSFLQFSKKYEQITDLNDDFSIYYTSFIIFFNTFTSRKVH
jgi:hypothetical protein